MRYCVALRPVVGKAEALGHGVIHGGSVGRFEGDRNFVGFVDGFAVDRGGGEAPSFYCISCCAIEPREATGGFYFHVACATVALHHHREYHCALFA